MQQLHAESEIPGVDGSFPMGLPRLDRDTASHCQRVTWHAIRLASALGLDKRHLEILRAGARLHDIGKASMPVGLLDKPGELSSEDWEWIRAHPVTGERIVAGMGLAPDIRKIVRHHHERWDGLGYPDGLVGPEIPRLARIVTIADFFDADLVRGGNRSGPRCESDVLRSMEELSGRVFDPELLDIFITLCDTGTPLPRSVA